MLNHSEPPIPADSLAVAPDLEKYGQYLLLLARSQVAPRLRDPVDLSGVVQQTLLEAHQKLAQFRGSSPEQLASWLRQILSHNLADAMRGLGAAKRDLRRRQSLQDAMAQPSVRLGAWLAADQSSPSQHAQGEERAVQLADALGQLPDAQREALVLQYWHGYTLAQIAAQMARTPAAVAGLLKRGLKQLQSLLGPD